MFKIRKNLEGSWSLALCMKDKQPDRLELTDTAPTSQTGLSVFSFHMLRHSLNPY